MSTFRTCNPGTQRATLNSDTEQETAVRRWLALALVIVVAMWPALAWAQQPTEDTDGLSMRIGGDYTLPAGQNVEVVIVIEGDALIEGTITDTLLIINGTATVRGTVEEDVVVIRGDLIVESTGTVNDVSLIRSDITEQPGATILGDVEKTNWWFSPGFGYLVGFLFYLAFTVFVIAAGLLFAAVGGKQLSLAAASMGQQTGRTILMGILAAIVLPIIAVAFLFTIVGIPIGIGILVFLVPVLWFLGYIVAGTWFGMLILGRQSRAGEGYHPYGEAALGLAILQAIGLIPGLWFVVFVLLGTWGTGAVVNMALSAARTRRRPGGEGGERTEEPAQPPEPGPEPASEP